MRPVGKAQDAYDSRGKDHAASDALGGSQVQAKPKAQQENNEETENDVIFSELDGKWCEFGRGIRGSGSRAKQRRNGSIEAVPRGGLLRSFLPTMRVLAEVMDSLMAGHVGRAGDMMAQRFRPKRVWGPALNQEKGKP